LGLDPDGKPESGQDGSTDPAGSEQQESTGASGVYSRDLAQIVETLLATKDLPALDFSSEEIPFFWRRFVSERDIPEEELPEATIRVREEMIQAAVEEWDRRLESLSAALSELNSTDPPSLSDRDKLLAEVTKGIESLSAQNILPRNTDKKLETALSRYQSLVRPRVLSSLAQLNLPFKAEIDHLGFGDLLHFGATHVVTSAGKVQDGARTLRCLSLNRLGVAIEEEIFVDAQSLQGVIVEHGLRGLSASDYWVFLQADLRNGDTIISAAVSKEKDDMGDLFSGEGPLAFFCVEGEDEKPAQLTSVRDDTDDDIDFDTDLVIPGNLEKPATTFLRRGLTGTQREEHIANEPGLLEHSVARLPADKICQFSEDRKPFSLLSGVVPSDIIEFDNQQHRVIAVSQDIETGQIVLESVLLGEDSAKRSTNTFAPHAFPDVTVVQESPFADLSADQQDTEQVLSCCEEYYKDLFLHQGKHGRDFLEELKHATLVMGKPSHVWALIHPTHGGPLEFPGQDPHRKKAIPPYIEVSIQIELSSTRDDVSFNSIEFKGEIDPQLENSIRKAFASAKWERQWQDGLFVGCKRGLGRARRFLARKLKRG